MDTIAYNLFLNPVVGAATEKSREEHQQLYINSTGRYKVQELESLTPALMKHHPFG